MSKPVLVDLDQPLDCDIHANLPRSFDFQEAKHLLPLVRKITDQAVKELAPIQHRIQNMVPADPRLPGLMHRYRHIVARWRGKMQRLGLLTHGLWQLGFDNGEGWWSWQYPERSLNYFQNYDQAFDERHLFSMSRPRQLCSGLYTESRCRD